MANKVIDATLRLIDKFTAPLGNAVKFAQNSSKQFQRAGQEIEKTGMGIKKFGDGLTTKVSIPIAAAGIASFKLASDLNESMNKVDVAFGKSAKSVKKWSKTTLEQYGLSQNTALETASLYGDMGTGMNLSTSQAAKMAKKLTGLSADLSSFKNVSQDVAKNALKGIYTGEGESLKSLGTIMNDTTLKQFAVAKGYKKSYANMTQAEKVQLRYKYVMEATKNAHGDFARTSDQAANQQRKFTEGAKELATSFGQKLLPIGLKVLKFGNDLMDKFNGLSDKQQDTIIKVLGIVAVVGPAISIFGKLTTGVGGIVTVFSKFGGAISTGVKAFNGLKDVGKIGGAFSKFGSIGKAAFTAITSPAGIAIIVIAAIAIAAFLIIKNWKKVKAFLTGLGKHIKQIFQKSGVDTKKFQKVFKSVKEGIKKLIDSLKIIFGNIIKFLKPVLTFLKDGFVANIKIGFSTVVGLASGLLNGIMGYIDGVIKVFNGLIKFVTGVFSGNWKQALDGIKQAFGGCFESFTSLVKTPFNCVIGVINGAIKGINSALGGVNIPDWVPGFGGKKFGINIPTIPMLAKGTKNWAGGLAMTQERGGEIMDLPKGTRVYPHDESIKMARAEERKKSSNNITISINKLADKVEVRSDSDIDTIVTKLADKLEKVINNSGKVEFV